PYLSLPLRPPRATRVPYTALFRSAFDSGAGVMLAILFRSGLTFLVLVTLLLVQRQSWRLPAGSGGWQLLLGLLIAVQSLCHRCRSEEHTSELQSRENLVCRLLLEN